MAQVSEHDLYMSLLHVEGVRCQVCSSKLIEHVQHLVETGLFPAPVEQQLSKSSSSTAAIRNIYQLPITAGIEKTLALAGITKVSTIAGITKRLTTAGIKKAPKTAGIKPTNYSMCTMGHKFPPATCAGLHSMEQCQQFVKMVPSGA